jgi:hypothetical protein
VIALSLSLYGFLCGLFFGLFGVPVMLAFFFAAMAGGL